MHGFKVQAAFFSCFQSIGSPVCSSSMVGHVSDLSLSGHSHTFTFSSSEVSLSLFIYFFLTISQMVFSLPNRFFSPPSLLSALIKVSSNFSPLPHSVCVSSLVSCQTLDDDPVPSNNNNQWQSRPILEWNSQQVCLWLVAMNMEQYAPEFTARGVDGTQLLNLDSEKLKVSVWDDASNQSNVLGKDAILLHFCSIWSP